MNKLKKILTQEEMTVEAQKRSHDYWQLSAEQQWEEDKELGILDWGRNTD